MATTLTIGVFSRRTGVAVETIRFYEAQGLLPPAPRSEAGYRLYGPTDVRRLRLIRRSRLLGMGLPEVKRLVEQAFDSECADYADQLLDHISQRRADIERRIAELTALQGELDELEQHVRHDRAMATPGQRVAECSFCPLLDEEGGEHP